MGRSSQGRLVLVNMLGCHDTSLLDTERGDVIGPCGEKAGFKVLEEGLGFIGLTGGS